MIQVAKRNNKRCFAPCDKTMIQSGQCTCHNQHDRIISIGTSLGARGCSLLIYETIALELIHSGIDIEILHGSLSRSQPGTETMVNQFAETCKKLGEVTNALTLTIKNYYSEMPYECLPQKDHRKQKYIRQQHKLAQRHYRRK
ncbi:hypothetical protein [Sphingobacterium yanglingense]|uniref:Uncharacterized protein n=1 Tax=Sphingobacterium yanglingense TaxID=1437280 RepID=A0A4R6WLB2_9SPHI|nr:hypothetical protein [Sphingobacterium yanglingense]TDQ79568.1 hypothetical protein CLV99_1013 [Sphingobacterium yanglingense]